MLPQIPQADLPYQPPTSEPFRSVPISIEPQLNSEWCWASVAAGINAFLHPSKLLTQCEVACSVTGGTCCSTGGDRVCNQPEDLEDVLTLIGLTVTPVETVPIADLASHINQEGAIAVRVRWPDDSGHFLVVVGVENVPEASSIQDLLVADPIYGRGVCSYSDLQTDYLKHGGQWSNTYYVE